MQQQCTLKLLPAEAASASIVQQYAASHFSVPFSSISGYHILKQSIDARSRQPWILLTIRVFINEPFVERSHLQLALQDVSKAPHKVIVVGAGPAGLFAALKLIEAGIQPILLERGKDVRSRRRDLA
ncbi:MAG: FAD-binding protein, partial [Flavobacterium psychrophilum]